MINFLRKILKPKYESLNIIYINARQILDNLAYLKARQGGAEIFPVLKSNAYGHGLKEMCLILNEAPVSMVVVDSFPEAQIAWKYFRGKVLIIGEMPLRAYDYCHFNRTEFIVYNEKTLKHLARYKKKAKIHLFYNSGMNREGIKDLNQFLSVNKKFLDAVDVVGFCSHLAAAEERTVLNQDQADKFSKGLMTLRMAGYFPIWVHLGNSAATLTINNEVLTAYRPGLALYGYDPLDDQEESGFRHNPELKPALKLMSTIISTQKLQAEETVSYNAGYIARQEANIAIIPFGYFEGLDRRLSNKAQFKVLHTDRSILARIAGRVCMNMTCLDCGVNDIYRGDRVLIVSDDKNDPNSIQSLAKIMNTVPYEVLVKIHSSIRREIIR